MTTVSVVLITKNQAWNIARLIESVLRETAGKPLGEIVLVDSASADATAGLASRYPIRVLQLHADQPLTPAAGRYVGYRYTSGHLVLFLDGDMQLCHGWLERALQAIENQPEVAAVTGKLIDLPKTATDPPQPPLCNANTGVEVPFCGGAAMYRRSVLEQVGSFNPYLCSDEEPDLCIRMRSAGFRVLRLEHPIAYHYSDPDEKIATLIGRWRRNLYLGAGQNIRYNLGTATLWPYLWERGFGCAPALGLAVGLISFGASLKIRRWILFRLWALAFAAIVAGDTCRKRSLYRTTASLLKRLFIVDGTVRGFLRRPLDPETYPGRYDVIK